MAEEYKRGSLAWRMHSSEAAHEMIEHELRQAREREEAKTKRESEKQSEEARFNEELRLADERRKAELAELRARQDAVSENIREAERKRLAHVLSPQGKEEGFQAGLNIDFFGRPPTRKKKKTLTVFPLIDELLSA